MSGILKEEILRIQEVMGISVKPIILESATNFISSFADEVGGVVASKLKNLIDNAGRESNVLVGGKRYRKIDVEKALRLAKDTDIAGKFPNASPNVQKIIKSVMAQDESLSDLAYNELIKHLKSKTEYKKEAEILKKVMERKTAIPNKDETVFFNKLFSDDWEDLLFIAEQAFRRQYDSYADNAASFKPISTKLAPTTQGVGRKLTPTEIAQAQKALRKERPKLFNRDYFNALRKSMNQVKAEIDELTQGYYDDMADRANFESLDSDSAKQIAREYAVQIVRRLNILEAKENNAAAEAMANRGIPENIIDIIKTDESEFFRLYTSIWGERQAKGFWAEIGDTTTDFLNDVKSLIIKNDKEGRVKWWKSLLNTFNPNTRFGQFLLTDSFAAYDRQWQQMIQQSGLQKGHRAQYILTMAYLNSVGYIVGSTIKDIMEYLFDINIANALNEILPIDIGIPGTRFSRTIPKIDNKESMEFYESVDGNLLLGILKSVYQILPNIWEKLTNKWGVIRSIKEVVLRALPFGLGTMTGSVDAQLFEFLTGLKIDNPKDYLVKIMGIFTAGEPAIVTPDWEDNKDSFKEWFKSNYPEDFDNVTKFKRVDNDGPDVYYVAKMAGGQTIDRYFLYDESEKTFKDYE